MIEFSKRIGAALGKQNFVLYDEGFLKGILLHSILFGHPELT